MVLVSFASRCGISLKIGLKLQAILYAFAATRPLLTDIAWYRRILCLEQNVLNKQSTTAADIVTPKISSKSDHCTLVSQVIFRPYTLMSWKSIILLGDVIACPWTPKNHLWHFWVIPTLRRGARCPIRSVKKWSCYVFDTFYENCHRSSLDAYFFMGSFLATQIEPGLYAHNKKVLIWQVFWGCRPLFMWILMQKNSVFQWKKPWNLPITW